MMFWFLLTTQADVPDNQGLNSYLTLNLDERPASA